MSGGGDRFNRINALRASDSGVVSESSHACIRLLYLLRSSHPLSELAIFQTNSARINRRTKTSTTSIHPSMGRISPPKILLRVSSIISNTTSAIPDAVQPPNSGAAEGSTSNLRLNPPLPMAAVHPPTGALRKGLHPLSVCIRRSLWSRFSRQQRRCGKVDIRSPSESAAPYGRGSAALHSLTRANEYPLSARLVVL